MNRVARILFLSLLTSLLSAFNYADWSVTQPETISINSTAENVFCCLDPATGNFLATWADENTSYATYSFYIPGTGWTPFQPISTSSNVNPYKLVTTVYIPNTQQFLAIWVDTNNNYDPTYSLYTPNGEGGGSWTPIETIPNSSSVLADVCLSVNSTTGVVLATWQDTQTNYPTYAFYTPGTGWGPINQISISSQVLNNVISCFDPISDQTIAAWGDIANNSDPTYSIYTPGVGWTLPATITTDPDYEAIDVSLSFDSATGTILATWGYLTYSFYTPGSGWGPISILAAGECFNVTNAFDPISGQFLAAWVDLANNNEVTYSFYTQGTGWSTASVIVPAMPTGADNVFLCFDPTTGHILATWADNNTNYPTYSIFQGPPPTGGVEGIVIDTLNRMPLGGVVVDIFRNEHLVDTTVTDDHGNYSVTGLSPDRYTLTASINGYKNAGASFVIYGEETTRVNLQLMMAQEPYSGAFAPSKSYYNRRRGLLR